MATDASGNVYSSGDTRGSLGAENAGTWDIILSKHNGSGDLLWTRQLGTAEEDVSFGVATDASGNVYASGYTKGSLDGENAGRSDVFLAKYDDSGHLLWTHQVGTPESDIGHDVATNASGDVYISGWTQGDLENQNAGGMDAFIVKFWTPGPGDADGNGLVDSSDLAIWQQHYDPLGLNENTFSLGDWNDDGLIDSGDLAIWQQNYDPLGVFGAAGTTVVPEPTTLSVLAFSGLVLLRRNGKRRISRTLTAHVQTPERPRERRTGSKAGR